MIGDGDAADGRATMLFFGGLCGLGVGALLAAEAKGAGRVRAVAKTLASLSFIAAALAAGALDTLAGRWILAGLALCAIGDVLLLWKSARHFLAGMAAFAAGHAAYVGGFIAAGAQYKPGVAAAALVTAWFVYALLRWLWPKLGEFRAPVAAYAGIIALMVVAGAAASLSTGDWRYALGAAMFALSDVFVARDRFVADALRNKAIGLPLYYGAQLILASAV